MRFKREAADSLSSLTRLGLELDEKRYILARNNGGSLQPGIVYRKKRTIRARKERYPTKKKRKEKNSFKPHTLEDSSDQVKACCRRVSFH